MSPFEPTNDFLKEWNIDPMLSSGPQLYASGSTVSGCPEARVAPQAHLTPRASSINGPSEASDDLNIQILEEDTNVFNHICYECLRSYKRQGDLIRHQKEKHTAASSKYLCPVDKCPRGIDGEGFGRMHHLVSHLKSKKHEMNGKEAVYLAHKHNMPKSKATEGEAQAIGA